MRTRRSATGRETRARSQKSRRQVYGWPETMGNHAPVEGAVPPMSERGGVGGMAFGELDLGLGYENHTSYPAPGQLLLYPRGVSETEILLAYGSVRFGSKVGQLAGNHFVTIVEGAEHLPELGRLTLWQGAQTIEFTLV